MKQSTRVRCRFCGNLSASEDGQSCSAESCPRFDEHFRASLPDEPEVLPMRVQNWRAQDDGLTPTQVRGRKVQVISHEIVPNARLKPHIANMLADAQNLVSLELLRMREQQLDADAKPISVERLERLVKSLRTLQQGELDQEKRDQPSDLADEDLLRDALRDPNLRETVRKLLSEYEG